jgi:Fic-DOC domain mobile mystery protein B
MGLNLEFTDGQTPLDEDDKEGLLIHAIQTKGELDEFEQQNIEKAIEWTLTKKFNAEEILSENFVRTLHRKMYGNVWKWAGEFRRTEKNIGIAPTQIGVSLKQINDNCLYWINNNVYPNNEIAIRYKHEIIRIHCFANGNGRHSRLIADIIINHVFGKPVFTWGQLSHKDPNESRNSYLKALKQADENNIIPLLEFAKK